MQEEKMVNPAMAAYPEAPKLDLSKIKNLDALESKDSSFAKQLEKTVKRTAKQNAVKKFNFVEEGFSSVDTTITSLVIDG